MLQSLSRRSSGVPASRSIDSSIPIHKCGMHDDFRANGLDNFAIMEQSVAHAALVIRAKLAGKSIPIHDRPGIQLFAIFCADEAIKAGAQGLASYARVDLEEMAATVKKDHISSC